MSDNVEKVLKSTYIYIYVYICVYWSYSTCVVQQTKNFVRKINCGAELCSKFVSGGEERWGCGNGSLMEAECENGNIMNGREET
jgi:hypothetical protein